MLKYESVTIKQAVAAVCDRRGRERQKHDGAGFAGF